MVAPDVVDVPEELELHAGAARRLQAEADEAQEEGEDAEAVHDLLLPGVAGEVEGDGGEEGEEGQEGEGQEVKARTWERVVVRTQGRRIVIMW